MKRLVSFNPARESTVRYSVLYDGEILHTDLSADECSEIIADYAEKYYESASEGQDFDLNLLTLEETRLCQ
jgi:hypothetical protein